MLSGFGQVTAGVEATGEDFKRKSEEMTEASLDAIARIRNVAETLSENTRGLNDAARTAQTVTQRVSETFRQQSDGLVENEKSNSPAWVGSDPCPNSESSVVTQVYKPSPDPRVTQPLAKAMRRRLEAVFELCSPVGLAPCGPVVKTKLSTIDGEVWVTKSVKKFQITDPSVKLTA